MTELTAELIADLKVPRGLQLSPDGRWVAYTLKPLSKAEKYDTSALWLVATDGLAAPRQFTAGTAHDHSPQWSPDGLHVAFLSDRAKRGTDQLYLISASGGEARPLTSTEHESAVQAFSWSPDGKQIAFSSSDEPTDDDKRREKERDDAHVYGERVPYARLRLVSVAEGEVTTLVAGERHVVAFAWQPRGDALAFIERPTPDLEDDGRNDVIRTVMPAGEVQTLCALPEGGGVADLVWSGDGQTLLLLKPVGRNRQASYAVYTLPAGGGDPVHLALGEDSCAGGLAQPLGSARAVAEVGRGLQTELHWLGPSSGALEPLYVPDPKANTDLAGWSVQVAENRTVVAAVQSSEHEPWEVVIGQTHGSDPLTFRQLTHHQNVTGLSFGLKTPFYWNAADGLELDGWLVRPPAATDKPLPAVVLVHGGPYGRWGGGLNLSWADWSQWLVAAGYAVLLPNPRGGYGHGEAFAGAVRGAVGQADFADVMSMVDAAVARGVADPERLGIGGWSQGGYMSAWAVTQTGRFKAAIMGAGVSDWGAMVTTSDVPDFERELGGSAPWDGALPHPHAALSPISFAKQVKTPVLILHGENDARVPLNQAVGFHRALREQQVTTELVVYPREPHGLQERAHQLDLLRRVRAWYTRWLGL